MSTMAGPEGLSTAGPVTVIALLATLAIAPYIGAVVTARAGPYNADFDAALHAGGYRMYALVQGQRELLKNLDDSIA